MQRILIAAATVTALGVPAMADSDMSSSSASTSPMIDASNAMVQGDKITNISAEIDRPGYLVIHNDGAGAPPAELGHIRLEPGKAGDLSIQANSELDPDSGLLLMLHYETNDNNTYDFGPGSTDVDTPVKFGDNVITAPVKGEM